MLLATFACDLDFTLDVLVSAPAFDFADLVSTPDSDLSDFVSLDFDEYEGASSISSERSVISAVFLSVFDLADLEGMDKDEGRTIIFDDLEGLDEEDEILRIFNDFAVMNESSSLAEAETEEEAFPALGRVGSLKRRYALEYVVAVAAAMVVARRDAMRKFMMCVVVLWCVVCVVG